MDDGGLALSVVVPTRDRAEHLPAFLESLAGCSIPDGGVELILVDDGSRPAVPVPTAPVAGRPVRLLRQPRRGPARARNLGARAARGRWLLFLADDLALAPDLLEAHVAAHRLREAAGRPWAFVGPIGPPPSAADSPFEGWLWRSGVHFDFGRLQREWATRGSIGPEGCYASNLSIDRLAFTEIGGFDEHYPGAAYEDLDLGVRWEQAGHALGYVERGHTSTREAGRIELVPYLGWKRASLPAAHRLLRRAPQLARRLARARPPGLLDRWSRVSGLGRVVEWVDRLGVPLPTVIYERLLAALAPQRRPGPLAEGPVEAGRIRRDPISDELSFDARRSDSVLAMELLLETLTAFRDVVPVAEGDLGTHIVEIGCGDGPLRVVLGIGPDAYVGLDRDPAANASVTTMDAAALPLGGEVASLVICSEVLEHLRSPRAALEEIWRVLAPGGRVLISTPFFYRVHDWPEDRWRFTETGLRVLLEQAGFEVERLRAVGGALSVTADLLCRSALPLVVRPVRALGERLGLASLERAEGGLEHRVSVASQRVFLALRRIGLARVRARGGSDRRARFLWDRSSRMTKGYVLVARKVTEARR